MTLLALQPEVIELTYTQYWTVAWMLFNVGWLYTVKTLFPFPDEVSK